MSYENLRLEKDGGIATITLDRPKVLNALNQAVLGELACALEDVANDAAIGSVVVTCGGDKAFVAGADIGELASMDPLGAVDLADRGQAVIRRLEELGKPTVAMINGFALGGGLELALACTLRTASTAAKVGLPETSLGIIPGYGGTQRLARIAGPGVAREWVLTGDMYSAEEAHRVGVVNRLFAPEELLEGTHKLVKTILSRGPIAVRLGMDLIRRGMDMAQRDGERMECDSFGLAATTADMKEGMTAFLEKRKPDFQGR